MPTPQDIDDATNAYRFGLPISGDSPLKVDFPKPIEIDVNPELSKATEIPRNRDFAGLVQPRENDQADTDRTALTRKNNLLVSRQRANSYRKDEDSS